MNDSEKRRQALLRETRRLYPDNRTPAIHPRYGAIYSNLYSRDAQPEESSLGVRIFISLILFALFAAADYNNETLLKYSSEQIVSEIQQTPNLSIDILNNFTLPFLLINKRYSN